MLSDDYYFFFKEQNKGLFRACPSSLHPARIMERPVNALRKQRPIVHSGLLGGERGRLGFYPGPRPSPQINVLTSPGQLKKKGEIIPVKRKAKKEKKRRRRKGRENKPPCRDPFDSPVQFRGETGSPG